jgi:hypothetical protein
MLTYREKKEKKKKRKNIAIPHRSTHLASPSPLKVVFWLFHHKKSVGTKRGRGRGKKKKKHKKTKTKKQNKKRTEQK